jgi:DNA-binding GntR family transcriptional regulator
MGEKVLRHGNTPLPGRVVEPIKNPKDIERVRSLLVDKPRDLLLFDLATQTGLRLKDLLPLKVKDLMGLEVGERLFNGNTYRNSPYFPVMTETVYESLHRYIQEAELKPEDYLFKSRKRQKPLNISSASALIRGWFYAANIKGLHAAKSLRKTWEYSRQAALSSPVEPRHYETTNGPDFLQPIKSLTLQERVYQDLLKAMVLGRIPPAARLTVSEISRRFQVSHMPVREALKRLEAAGYVTSQKKRGVLVNELTRDKLREITTIRLNLECLAAKLACKSLTEETLSRLESLFHAYSRTQEPEEFLSLNKEFHHTMYRDAHMPMLEQFITMLMDRESPYLHLYYMTIARPSDLEQGKLLQFHEGILEGIRRKDSGLVCKWLRVDLTHGAKKVEEMLGRIRDLVDVLVIKTPFYNEK